MGGISEYMRKFEEEQEALRSEGKRPVTLYLTKKEHEYMVSYLKNDPVLNHLVKDM